MWEKTQNAYFFAQNSKTFCCFVVKLESMPYLGGMKESFHICYTSHEEVMFRDAQDHDAFVNLLALRSYANDTEILVDAEMSTHVHLGIFSNCPQVFASSLRMSYTKYFNRKYGREGRLGEKYTFQLRVDGFVHQMVMQNYVLRNGLHHGAAPTAFGYPYCTVRDLFAEDIGLSRGFPVPMSRTEMESHLPQHAEFPDSFRMNERGVFVRSSFMELRKAEQYYGSPRNYLYQMNRLTDDSWAQEQLKDQTGAHISLADIERLDDRGIAQLLKNESGRYYSRSRMQDLDVCRLIDQNFLSGTGAISVYGLTASQKQRVARQLLNEFHLPEHQIRRCLVLP